jgi:hypothetical protein
MHHTARVTLHILSSGMMCKEIMKAAKPHSDNPMDQIPHMDRIVPYLPLIEPHKNPPAFRELETFFPKGQRNGGIWMWLRFELKRSVPGGWTGRLLCSDHRPFDGAVAGDALQPLEGLLPCTTCTFHDRRWFTQPPNRRTWEIAADVLEAVRALIAAYGVFPAFLPFSLPPSR